jgi:hypothetical protein
VPGIKGRSIPVRGIALSMPVAGIVVVNSRSTSQSHSRSREHGGRPQTKDRSTGACQRHRRAGGAQWSRQLSFHGGVRPAARVASRIRQDQDHPP